MSYIWPVAERTDEGVSMVTRVSNSGEIGYSPGKIRGNPYFLCIHSAYFATFGH